MQRTNGKLITPAEYARLRQLNRSTVSRQVRDGKIPTHGGMLDPVEADRARQQNLNGTRHRQATERKAARAAKATPCPLPAAPVVPVGTTSSEAHAAVVAALRTITAPTEVLTFARVALRAGCTAAQAYALATWASIQPCLSLASVSCDDLIDFTAPTEGQWRDLFGKDFDLAAADDLENEITVREVSPDSAATAAQGAL